MSGVKSRRPRLPTYSQIAKCSRRLIIEAFVRDMPRLSVDIDLTDVWVEAYEHSLAVIDPAMDRIADRIKSAFRRAGIRQGLGDVTSAADAR